MTLICVGIEGINSVRVEGTPDCLLSLTVVDALSMCSQVSMLDQGLGR